MAEVSGEMIYKVLQTIQRELRDLRAITLQTSDAVRRLDRRMGEQTDDLELMLKSELMGWSANLETRLDLRLGDFDDRLRAIETRPETPAPGATA